MNRSRKIVLLWLVLVFCLTGANRLAGSEEIADDGKLRILCIGAHPDDAEYKCGGTAALWAAQGHHVKLVSVTNGDIGHWEIRGEPLAEIRAREVREAGQVLGVTADTLDIHDGELMPTLENRKRLVRLIREWKADIVIAHRPWDYHPDHRYVGVLVQDAAFMVMVPFFCPDTPHLKENPVFLYSSDRFQKPYPFEADIAVSIDDVFEQKVVAISKLVSQNFGNGALGSREEAGKWPSDPEERLDAIRKPWEKRQEAEANRVRKTLVRWYGPKRGSRIKYAEAFEICEYGSQPTKEQLKNLFPFFGEGAP